MDKGITFAEWREDWIKEGMRWQSSSDVDKPLGWNPCEQLGKLSSYGCNSQRMVGFRITYEFIKQVINIHWQDIYYGLEHSCIGLDVVRQFGDEMSSSTINRPDEPDASFSLSNMTEVLSRIKVLADSEQRVASDELNRRWLFILLSWLYEHRQEYEDPLQMAQIICDDFGCPARVTSFVWHMFPQNADLKTLKAHDAQMMTNWRTYVEDEKRNWGM